MSKLDRISPAVLASNPRATLSAYLRYSTIISEARRAFPQPYSFSPFGSTNSTASKLRDAIRGAIAFGYVPDPDALRTWYSQIAITHDQTSVHIGPPKDKNVEPLPVKRELTFDSLSLDELRAFALLLSNERITGPVVLLNAQRFSTFQSPEPNCMVQYSNGTLTLL